MFQQVSDFLEESEALYALLAGLRDADFERKTQFRDYTISDVVGHIHQWNFGADLALRDAAAFEAFFEPMRQPIREGRSLAPAARAWIAERGLANRGLVRAWRRCCQEMAERFGAADPKARVPWAGPPMSVRSSITARQMETWAHGQDLFDALGVERVDADRIRNIANLGVLTFGWTFSNRGLAVPADRPYVSLRAPSGAIWEWGKSSGVQRVEGEASEFCQVVTQVRHLRDTRLTVVGDVAERWMSMAQCFAGAPMDAPEPGTRFRRNSP